MLERLRPAVPALLATIVVVLGLQALRALLPALIWFLGDSLPVEGLLGYALALFATVLLAPVLSRALGARRLLFGVVIGLALSRGVLQFSDHVVLDLVAASAGVMFFVLALSLLFGLRTVQSEGAAPSLPPLAIGVPLALLIDAAGRVLLSGYDLVWAREPWAIALGVLLVAILIALAWLQFSATSAGESPAAPRSSFGLYALGAWVFLAMGLVFNQQAVAGTGVPEGIAGILVILTAAAGVFAAIASRALSGARLSGVVAASALVLLFGGVLFYLHIGPGALWTLLMGVAGSVVMTALLQGKVRATARDVAGSGWRASLALFVGLVAFLGLALAGLYEVTESVPAAAIIIAALGGAAVLRDRAAEAIPVRRPVLLGVSAVAIIGLLGGGVLAIGGDSAAVAEDAAPTEIRVMTYNIHQALDADLHVDLAEIAQVVKEQNPDILALNEVNRGRPNNGYVDSLATIAKAIGMPYVYGANSADGLYGNALFSRFPIVEAEYHHYAAKTTETRGVLEVTLDVAGTEITVLATHLDHISGEKNVRADQLAEAVDLWAGRSRTIILGDLNTTPDQPEVGVLLDAGFLDLVAESADPGAPTFWSEPPTRLDYIFVTPDLSDAETAVVGGRASDHLAVVSVIQLAG